MISGVTPLPESEMAKRRTYLLRVLPDDVKRAWYWLSRGHPATTRFLPSIVRQTLLRRAGIQIGDCVYGLEKCWFHNPNVEIGDATGVGFECWFEGQGQIHIGANCLIAAYTVILTSNHPISPEGEVLRPSEYHDVWIGDRCWLGARVTVTPGVRIGDGVIIASGSVVTKDCEPGGIYGGVPAKRLR